MTTIWLVLKKYRYHETDSYGAGWTETIKDIFVAAYDSEEEAQRALKPGDEDISFVYHKTLSFPVLLEDGSVVNGRIKAVDGVYKGLGRTFQSSRRHTEPEVVSEIRQQISGDYYVKKYEIQ